MASREQRQRSDERSSQSSSIQKLSDLRRQRSNHDARPSSHEMAEQLSLEDSDCENEQQATNPTLPAYKPLRRLAQTARADHHDSVADDLSNALQSFSLNSNRSTSATRPSAQAPAVHPAVSLDDDSGLDDFASAGDVSDTGEDQLLGQPTVPCHAPLGAVKASSESTADQLRSRVEPSSRAESATVPATPAHPPLVLGDRGQFILAPHIAGILYDHQTVGVRWLWSLHANPGKGGILGEFGRLAACCPQFTSPTEPCRHTYLNSWPTDGQRVPVADDFHELRCHKHF